MVFGVFRLVFLALFVLWNFNRKDRDLRRPTLKIKFNKTKTMKNYLILVLLAFAFGLNCFAGGNGKEPILKYGSYSPEDIRALATGISEKARQYADLTVAMVNRKLHEEGFKKVFSSVSEVFDYISEQEIRLNPRHWRNSCWNSNTQRIEWDPNLNESDYEGFAGIFVFEENGRHISFPVYKRSCANLLDVQAITSLVSEKEQHEVLLPDSVVNDIPNNRVDTIYKVVWVQNAQEPQQCYVVCSACQQQYSTFVMPYIPWMGWSGGYGGGYSNNTTNITYYSSFNNENITTIYNNNYHQDYSHRTRENGGGRVTPHGQTDVGQRVTPHGQDDVVNSSGRGYTPNGQPDRIRKTSMGQNEGGLKFANNYSHPSSSVGTVSSRDVSQNTSLRTKETTTTNPGYVAQRSQPQQRMSQQTAQRSQPQQRMQPQQVQRSQPQGQSMFSGRGRR